MKHRNPLPVFVNEAVKAAIHSCIGFFIGLRNRLFKPAYVLYIGRTIRMNKICVFCGSNHGGRAEFTEAAKKLGHSLADRNIELVYGGGKVGIMGEIADAVLDKGAKVIGVMPGFLVKKEVAHSGLSDLKIVETMHERKNLMAELSDAFIALPGGLGTIEEFFEVVTWAQLGIHKKPCGLLNVCGYFENLIMFLDNAVSEKFLREEHRQMIFIHESPEHLLDQFESYKAPTVTKWMDLKN
jgi:uncharacterized protein (TIGR00730 family)